MSPQHKQRILASFNKVECPKCHSKVGLSCRNKQGQFRNKPHIKRTRELYKQDNLVKGKYLSMIIGDLIQRIKTLEHANFVEEEFFLH